MALKLVCAAVVALVLQIIGAARVLCPNDPNCVCGGTLAVELNCNIDGRTVKINLLPDTYMNIKCENATSLDYSKMPKCADGMDFKSVSFKDCPLPTSSFKGVLMNMGVLKTRALIFQNGKKLSGFFDRKHFSGLQDLTKLLLSINGITHLPDNLFVDINKLTWLNIRSNTINLSEELFKPLERLETLEISHNHMTNISSNLFSHLSYLRKLSLWQSNVTWFSKDLFMGVDVLEELDLSSNGLNELPSSIFKPLRKLKKLTLFSNKFSALPQNLFKHNVELETVIILNNDEKLKKLPKFFFGSLDNLREIYIQKSGLESLPFDVFADSPKVTNISLAYNDIQTLPESIFNDQINLLELDLSYNKLSSLEPKIFSSLVRLETLNLNHNKLVKITGSTFSSLLSLIHLNMEHNKMNTISSYLFSNNKQKMIISLAHNKLSFQEKEQKNNNTFMNKTSPFAHTYNLASLNLSHNDFKVSFEDWWTNGHDNLDISYNDIRYLWPEENVNKSYHDLVTKRLKKVWVSGNPLYCQCWNYLFIDFLLEDSTEIYDNSDIGCPLWARRACYSRYGIIMSVIVSVACFYVFVIIGFVVYRNHLMAPITRVLKNVYEKYAPIYCFENFHGFLIVFVFQDREFVYQDFLPTLKAFSKTSLGKEFMPVKTYRERIIEQLKQYLGNNSRKRKEKETIVIFSSNYLLTRFNDVSIKNILSTMQDAQNTIHVFADIGPDNSIYAFLKDNRDITRTFVWNEQHQLAKILLDLTKGGHLVGDCKNLHDITSQILNGKNDMLNKSDEVFLLRQALDDLFYKSDKKNDRECTEDELKTEYAKGYNHNCNYTIA